MQDIRDNWYVMVLIRGMLLGGKLLGMFTLAAIWLACLASFGLYFYAKAALPLPDPAQASTLGWLFVVLGLTAHMLAWLPPFSWVERGLAWCWTWARPLVRRLAQKGQV